jgi:hypothetical protein
VTTAHRAPATRLPWHAWVVALVALALYVGGARDFLLVLVQDTGYIVGQFGPGGLAYFADYPPALRVVWAVTVLSGLAAPGLLLARSRWAVPAALVGVATQVLLLVVTFAARDRWTALGAATAWFDIGIAVVAAFLARYCWTARRRGLLHRATP